MVEELIQLDKDLFLFLNNLGTPNWDGFWMLLTNKFSAFPLYAFLLLMSYRQFGTKKTLVILVSVALLITATNGLADFFKNGVQRLRPCYDPEINEIMRLVKKSCGGTFGYFSAHAANSFAVAFFFAFLLRHTFKYIGFLLIFWAILVSYSRIYIGVHFPLDILTGAVVGLIFSWVFAKLYIFAIHKFHL